MNDPGQTRLLERLAAAGHPALRLLPLIGDVSRRAYLRAELADGSSAVVATYPTNMIADCDRFARTTRLLEAAGVRVPRILANRCAEGWMLLEDAGDETLYDYRGEPWDHLVKWLERAAEIGAAVGRIPLAEVRHLSPALDGDLMQRELAQTWDLLLEPRGLAGTGATRKRLQSALEQVCRHLDGGPQAVCHRDFMARNLIPQATGELVVIDHQDLRLGPAAYDLASLLNDSLFPPAEIELSLLDRYLAPAADIETYRRCVVQRALKACGTFAAFARRGSSRHLRLIGPTLARAAENLERLPEGRQLGDLALRWRALSVHDNAEEPGPGFC